MADLLRLHASCVRLGAQGVLIRGKPGSGKSDLALRLMDEPGYGMGEALLRAQLVADDQVEIRKSGERLVASAPETLAGLLEIRGLGIVRFPWAPSADLSLIVDLDGQAERLPGFGGQTTSLLGLPLPILYLPSSLASAPARVRAALAVIGNPSRLRA
jgi:HPr kinase/phosphorylase